MSALNILDIPAHPQERAARYLNSGVWASLPIGEEFHAVAQRCPDREAVIDAEGMLTYGELDRRSDQVAAWLIQRGLQPGESVLFQAGNRAETVLAWYAVLKAGAIPVCTLVRHRSNEIGPISSIVQPAAHIIDADAAADLHDLALDNQRQNPSVRLLLAVGGAVADDVFRIDEVGFDISESKARAVVEKAQEGLRPSDVAVFQLSGGTTALPKVIARLHGEYWGNAVQENLALGRDKDVRIAHVMPILHNAGAIHALLGAHCVGGCLVTLNFGPPDQMLGFMADTNVNDMMVGTPFLAYLDSPAWLRLKQTLKRVMWTGTKMPPEAFAVLDNDGMWVGQMWGMAEGSMLLTKMGASADMRRESVGVPLYPHDEYKITQLDGATPVPDGETGLLWFRGPSTIPGYVNAAAHNETAFVDGFVNTGDLARVVVHLDGSQSVAIEGRVKDVISRGGEKISTEEIEKLLLQHPDVIEAAVVAVPDDRLGERACAYLVAGGGKSKLDLEQVRAHLDGLGVAKFKWPEELHWLDGLPRTNTLKIDKVALREDALNLSATTSLAQ